LHSKLSIREAGLEPYLQHFADNFEAICWEYGSDPPFLNCDMLGAGGTALIHGSDPPFLNCDFTLLERFLSNNLCVCVYRQNNGNR
jgi:hypothetical protein